MTDANTWLIRIHTAPYVSPRAALGLDATLACGAFGQTVKLVLEGPAIELLKPLPATPEGGRNLHKMIASLPLYDVERVYLLSEDLSSIPDTTFDELQITRVNNGELANLIANSRHVLSF